MAAASGTAAAAGSAAAAAAPPSSVSPRQQFLRRALAVEVIQRAFSTEEDIEPGQRLLFAQLTPLAPTRIFSATPFNDQSVPDSGRKKLTGIEFAHFSGFYRRAWR